MRSDCEDSPLPAPGFWDFSVDKWFSARVGFAAREHLAVSRDMFGCHSWERGGPTGIQWDTAQHRLTQGQLPHNKALPHHKFYNAKVAIP